MGPSLKESAQRVQDALTRENHPGRVRELLENAHTAAQAASALHCEIAQIVKSLIFQGVRSQAPYLLLLGGNNRVDLTKVASVLGEPVQRADPDWVKSLTGFAIGGIPPIAHAVPIRTLMDEELFHYSELWAAAGHPHAVFLCNPQDLQRLTDAVVTDIHQT